jgi:hypothetical protein
MSEDVVITCIIKNDTHLDLIPQSHSLSCGKFADVGNHPPRTCPAHTTTQAFRSSGKSGSAVGTEGVVVYQLGALASDRITISWEVTYLARNPNRLTITPFHPHVFCTQTNWIGRDCIEAPIITIEDKR